MRYLLILLVLPGCHGSDLFVGGGKVWQDQGYKYSGGCGVRGSGDMDDSWVALVGARVQLTPDTVVQL